MGYLRRLVLVNSAGYPFADVRLDGHCDMAGGQGVGKTTLMNAILFPYVVEDNLLDIDRFEKTRFSLYYFPETTNSFVIYEVVNNLDVPYSIFIHRIGQALQFHFISAPFSLDWLYEGDEQVKDWGAVHAKLKSEGIHIDTLYTMKDFNERILGKGKAYNEQYSIVRSPKDKDAIRPLLSAIFKNRPFSQETLKDSLIAAVLTSNQIESDYIDLGSHRHNLDGFEQRLSDIRKMTVRGKDGKTAIEDLAKNISSAVDSYNENRRLYNRIPGLLAYALPNGAQKLSQLAGEISELKGGEAALKASYEERESFLENAIEEAANERGSYERALKTIKEIKEKYKKIDFSFEDLVSWAKEKSTHEAIRDEAQERFDALTADSKHLRQQMEAARYKNKLFYQNKEHLLNKELDKIIGQFRAEQDRTRTEEEQQKQQIIAEYQSLLGDDWKKTEIRLLDAMVTLSVKLATCETIDEVRSLVGSALYAEDLLPILSSVLEKKGAAFEDIEALKSEVAKARRRIEDELDRKESIEKEKAEKLARISRATAATIQNFEEQVKAAQNDNRNARQQNLDECNAADESIRKDYEAKIHGNDPVIKAAIEQLQSTLEDKKLILEQIALYPTILDDKKLLDSEPAVSKKWNELNIRVTALRDEKKKARQEYEEEVGSITAKISDKNTLYRNLDKGIKEVENYLDNHSSMRAAYDEAEPLENEKEPSDILTEYHDLQDQLRTCEENIRLLVPKLYGPNMLSRLDTFQLGIGLNDRISTFEDYMIIADKLRTRLMNFEGEMGLDKYIRINTDIWLNEIRDISTIMAPVEIMLSQIQKLCRQVSSFVKKNNRTDCIDAFKMEVNENDATGLVKLLRETAAFYQDNYTILGFGNLFGSEDEPANKKALSLLEKISHELEGTSDNTISISSMFDIRMDVTEKGNSYKNILSFNNLGSKGTANVLKAMLNMTLLHVVLGKEQAENSRLICAIDEMNTIEASNLDALKEFAEAAGLFIFGSGQHHTQSALDYSYNVWDERDENGVVNKWIDMQAVKVDLQQENENHE